jgi:hypothetical protein
MKAANRLTNQITTMKKTLAWAFLAAFFSTLAACGGGGGSSSSSTSTTGNSASNTSSNTPATTTTNTVSSANPTAEPVTQTAANAVPIQVAYAPSPFNQPNDPTVSVTICSAGSNAASNCTTIGNVLVDTESFGLRLFASAIPNLASLPGQTQSGQSGVSVAECAIFGSGYSWGTVRNVDIKIGGEVAQNVPIQVMADTSNLAASAPSACNSQAEYAAPSNLGANGILGIGVAKADCGSYCASGAPEGWYYACSGSSCTPISQQVSQQVSNPVPYFSTDNNGVVVELPPVAAGGSASANGMLLFGIDTQPNNALAGSATILATNGYGDFNATYNGVTYTDGFFDSGSTFMYFQDSSISTDSSRYYIPSTTLARSVSIAGSNSVTATVNFNVGNASTLFNSGNVAFNNVGQDVPGAFDMGMPFFFGRHMYYGITGAAAANGVTGPFVAFTSS